MGSIIGQNRNGSSTEQGGNPPAFSLVIRNIAREGECDGRADVKKGPNGPLRPAVFPAKAGIHRPVDAADALWIPAFAGKTEVLHI